MKSRTTVKLSLFALAIVIATFPSCRMRDRGNTAIQSATESSQDTLSPLVVYDGFTMDDEYFTGPFHIDRLFGHDNRAYDEREIPDIPGLQYYSLDGRHLAVRCPDYKPVRSLVSERIKRFADWCLNGTSPTNTVDSLSRVRQVPSAVPICKSPSSTKEMCSYYMKYIGQRNVSPCDTSSTPEQFALCLVDAYESGKYCTMQEYTWYDNGGVGDNTALSWFTVDKKAGKVLSLSDIVDEENRSKFAYRVIRHLRDRSWPWFDISRGVREDSLVDYLSMASGIALAPEGVIVYYHRQVIGCGEEGQYNALVPYSEVADIIKARF